MAEARGERAGRIGCSRITAQLQRTLDERLEVFPAVGRSLNVHHAGVRHRTGGEHAVGVGGRRRHEAVRGEQDGRGQVGELDALALPCGSHIALEVGIALQLGIRVRGKQLAVRVDVHAAAFRLIEQQLEVVQVVTRDHNEGAGFHRARHRGGLRRAERLGVRPIEQLHTAQVHLAHLERQRQQHVGVGLVVGQRGQAFMQEGRHRVVAIAQRRCMIGVGRQPAQTEQHQRLERTRVLGCVPQHGQIVVGRSPHLRRRCNGIALGMDAREEVGQGRIVEINVRQRSEQTFHRKIVRRSPRVPVHPRSTYGSRQSNERARHLVLQNSRARLLAAHAGRPGAASTSSRLLALEAEHRRRIAHVSSSLAPALKPRQSGAKGDCPPSRRMPFTVQCAALGHRLLA